MKNRKFNLFLIGLFVFASALFFFAMWADDRLIPQSSQASPNQTISELKTKPLTATDVLQKTKKELRQIVPKLTEYKQPKIKEHCFQQDGGNFKSQVCFYDGEQRSSYYQIKYFVTRKSNQMIQDLGFDPKTYGLLKPASQTYRGNQVAAGIRFNRNGRISFKNRPAEVWIYGMENEQMLNYWASVDLHPKKR